MSINTVIFTVIFAAAILLFCWSCFNRFRLITLGKPEDRFSNAGRRLQDMFLFAFGQKRVISRPFGLNHFFLFWSFAILLIANVEFCLHGLLPDAISLSFLPSGIYYTLAFIFDVVSLVALVCVCIACIRRLVFPPDYIDARSRDAFIILGLVAALMICFFGLHGSEIARGIEGAARYMPIASLVAFAFFTGIPEDNLITFAEIFWWAHALILLGF